MIEFCAWGKRRGLLPLAAVALFWGNSLAGAAEHHGGRLTPREEVAAPSFWLVAPFVLLLLCIAVFPLIHRLAHWWEKNRNRLLVALLLGAATLAYYLLAHGYYVPDPAGSGQFIVHQPGLDSLQAVLAHAVLFEYVPFIVLLFSLYVISGGIQLKGDLPAHPTTNLALIALGGVLASFIGTTGAAMLLIRPLLQTNSERKHVVHTVIFFIFVVCNCGGLLLPIGDPPLFLGYLRGVPFFWTLGLIVHWLFVNGILLAIYYLWDARAYAREEKRDLWRDETRVERLRLRGGWNFLLLLGVVFCVATMVPGKNFLGLGLFLVPPFLREAGQLALAAVSYLLLTPRGLRQEVHFNFAAIGEVAALFIGIFITMQVPIELLNLYGARLGINADWKFFWATGTLSSFLDNAPTYVVFFEAARSLSPTPLPTDLGSLYLTAVQPPIKLSYLVAVSAGAVFMGANTYIGNGPNFLVKSIAEQAGLKMPTFFGYMKYSTLILVPIFVLVTLVFFRP